MEIIAKTSVRVAPRKVRLVADYVRKLSLMDALSYLAVSDKRASVSLAKTIKSAIANAKINKKIEENDLFLKSIEVLEASSYKRYHPSTRGRIHPYKRRGSNIKVVLEAKAAAQSQPKLPEKVQSEEKSEKSKEKKGKK